MISIIIACYNGEKYIARMLDSLCEQSDKEFEVILVNDGSTDRSVEIIKFYEDRLPVKLISTENRGVSHARNIGINHACGDYLLFFDCDDKVDRDMISVFKQLLEKKKDLYLFNYCENEKIVDEDCKSESFQTKDDLFKAIIEKKSIKGYVWNKAFKTDIIRKNDLRFEEKVSFCEDLLFLVQYIQYIDTFLYVPYPFYHYYKNEGSISKNLFSVKKVSALQILEKCIEYFQNNKMQDTVKVYVTYYYNFLISLLMYGKYELKGSELGKRLNKKLYQYPFRELLNARIKISVILGRISPGLLYLIWKMSKR